MHHEVSLITYYLNSWFGLHLADHAVMATFVFLVAVLVFVVLSREPELIPSPIQAFYEGILKSIGSILKDSMGRKGLQFLPFVTALAVFIFLSNVIGLVPGFTPTTGNLNTTVGCALAVFLYYNYHGVKEHGWGYLKHFTGPVWWLAWLMLPIEIISHLARPFSLSVRLFANMFADHMVLAVFVALVPFLVPVPLLGVGLFVCFIQTLIFIVLTAIYLAGSVSEAH